MPRYYFNARLGIETIIDAAGADVESLEKAQQYVEAAIVEFGADLDPDWEFEIQNEAGELLARVRVGNVRGERH
jgi:hypothetical protein